MKLLKALTFLAATVSISAYAATNLKPLQVCTNTCTTFYQPTNMDTKSWNQSCEQCCSKKYGKLDTSILNNIFKELLKSQVCNNSTTAACGTNLLFAECTYFNSHSAPLT